MIIIRNYRPGDEEVQVAIYNEAAGALPKFKLAQVNDVRRRTQARDFDPSACFYAVEGSQVVGYATFQPNGRVNYPWCRPGHEAAAEPLFQRVWQALKSRNIKMAFAAYREDWPSVREFFQHHGFRQARDMTNYVLDLADMPTPSAKPRNLIAPLQGEDLPFIMRLGAGVLRVSTEAELEKHLFHNPCFPPEAVFVLRARSGTEPLAVGLFIEDPAYADPKQVDANMPCFRLGAFGTEGMTTKRINGLFSFLAREDPSLNSLGLDLVGHAAFRLSRSDIGTFAAQVPSDAPHLVRFYQSHFKRQGSFPIFAKEVGIRH
jgi:hypothetical protein